MPQVSWLRILYPSEAVAVYRGFPHFLIRTDFGVVTAGLPRVRDIY